MEMIFASVNDLRKIVKDALLEFDQERYQKIAGQKTYSINEVAKRLKMSHNTVKKYVLSGIIKSTTSGRITEEAINDYLSGK